MKRISAALAASTLMLSGCATIIEGSSQEIAVVTNPSGANCNLVRQGISIGRISPTPGSIPIEKNKNDINVDCELEGYHKEAFLNESDVAAAFFGNLIIGGIIGGGIDLATGAWNKYDSPVNVDLKPKSN